MKTSETTTSETSGASTVDAGAHLDTFIIPENDEFDVDPDAPQAIGEDGEPIEPEFAPERLDKAAFYITFKMVFDVPQMFDPDFQPLAIQQGEADQARVASDAAYDLLEIWYPSALEPNSATIGHLMVLAPFIMGKAMIARAILRAKHEAANAIYEHGPAVEPDQPQAANDNHAPSQPKGVI